MNWKLKLLQILHCFENMEGTWYELEWESFGITPDEKREINQAMEEYRKQHEANKNKT